MSSTSPSALSLIFDLMVASLLLIGGFRSQSLPLRSFHGFPSTPRASKLSRVEEVKVPGPAFEDVRWPKVRCFFFFF